MGRKDYEDKKTQLYICKNCGTCTLLINEDEQELLSEYEMDDDLLTEEYDVEIPKEKRDQLNPLSRNYNKLQTEFNIGYETFKKEYDEIVDKYWHLLTSGAIELSDHYEKIDNNAIHIKFDYSLNPEVNMNYCCVSDDILEEYEKIEEEKSGFFYSKLLKEEENGTIGEYHSKELKNIRDKINEIEKFEETIHCNLCFSSDIELVVLNKIVNDYHSIYNERVKNNIKLILEAKNKVIEKNIFESVNYSKDVVKLRQTSQKAIPNLKRINIQELLSNLINSDKNIQLLEEELKIIIKKKEEHKFLLSSIFYQIKNNNIKSIEYSIMEKEIYEEPEEPEEPEKPNYRKIGLFTKKADQEYNEKLEEEYKSKMKKYEDELSKYNKEIEKYNNNIEQIEKELNDEKESIDNEFIKLLDFNNEKNDFIVKSSITIEKDCKKQLDEAINIYKALLADINETEEYLIKWNNTKNDLISLNVIFPKYNNIVAWTTLNEYFITGRVNSLDGPNGAYNLFENETRANIIITQLDIISNKLDDIKQNQYILYEIMSELSNNVKSINKKMDTELTLSALTAYNTERTARYAKLTSELTGINMWLNASKK